MPVSRLNRTGNSMTDADFETHIFEHGEAPEQVRALKYAPNRPVPFIATLVKQKRSKVAGPTGCFSWYRIERRTTEAEDNNSHNYVLINVY